MAMKDDRMRAPDRGPGRAIAAGRHVRRRRDARKHLWTAGLLAGLMVLGLGRAEPRDGDDRDRGRTGRVTAGGGRGRHATAPSEIPAKGWKDVLRRTWEEISEDRILMVAAGVTFYALLAIFPAIAALVSLYGLVADPATIGSTINSLSSVLPGGAIDVLGDQLRRLTSHPSGGLSIGFAVGLVIALWSANSGVKAMFEAINIAYDETERRGFVRLNAVSLAFTLGAILLIVLALIGIAVVPVVLNFVGLGPIVEKLVSILRWPLLLIVVAVAVALLYRYGPSRRKAKWRWITWGSAFASVAWLAVSILFSWYVSNFGSYDKTYGSLGAAIGFMTWIWLSTIVVLIGAELDSEMEHQTAADTTEGTGKPLGARDATVADTVGAATTA